jgi:N4-gp56 family major capsid protein
MANVNTTDVLTQEMMTFYEKVFLDRAKVQLVNGQGANVRNHPQNSGKAINFTRVVPLAISTTALAEGSNPSPCVITASTVTATMSEYGAATIHSRLISLTSIDQGMKETIDAFGQNMGETINAVDGLVLACGTAFYPNGHGVSTVTTGDVLNASAIVYLVQQMELTRTTPYADGFFLGKTTIQNKVSLLKDTTWVAAKEYSDVKDLYKGEMGELYQVRWLLNGQTLSGLGNSGAAACTSVCYYSYVHGQNAFGRVNLEGDMPKLYITQGADSGNIANRAVYIAWAGSYTSVLLNSTWSFVLKAVAA